MCGHCGDKSNKHKAQEASKKIATKGGQLIDKATRMKFLKGDNTGEHHKRNIALKDLSKGERNFHK